MKKFAVIIALLTLCSVVNADTGRKLIKKDQPTYPALARQMHISGTVKLEATVAANGKVTEVKVIGGHPVLSSAAVDAAKKWQYEAAGQESVETISVNFMAQQ